jgi:acyl-ACP thioesterase
MYTFDSRVRYSETDPDGVLTLTGIINYMQDVSTFQTEDIKKGADWMLNLRRIWMMSGWHIVIDRYPVLGEKLRAGTWHCGSRGIYGYRSFCIWDEAGEAIVRASSKWFMYDRETGHPARVLESDIEKYGTPGQEPDLGEAPARIRIPDSFEEKESITISPHYLDTNHHVNNARYIEMAQEALPGGLKIRIVRADYKKAAVLGDKVIPRVTKEVQDCWTVVLVNQDGETYAAIWLRTEAVDGMKGDRHD